MTLGQLKKLLKESRHNSLPIRIFNRKTGEEWNIASLFYLSGVDIKLKGKHVYREPHYLLEIG